jgi:hypothetical protein
VPGLFGGVVVDVVVGGSVEVVTDGSVTGGDSGVVAADTVSVRVISGSMADPPLLLKESVPWAEPT